MTRTVKLHAFEFSLSVAGDDGKVVAEYRNPRTFSALSDVEIAELADDLHTRGLEVPPKVRRVVSPTGEVHELVLDGQRRIMALRLLFNDGRLTDDNIPVQADRLSDEEPLPFTGEVAAKCWDDALAIGTKRAGLTSYELASAGAQMQALDKSGVEIAKSIGRSTSWVSRMLSALKKATPSVIDAWKNGAITDEQFKEIGGAAKATQPDALAEVLGLREKGDKAAARATAKVLAPQKSAAKETRKPKDDEAPVVTKAGQKYLADLDGDGSSGGKSGGAHLGMSTGKGGTTPAAAAPKAQRPGSKQIQEFVELRKYRPTDPYIRGALDMAAFANGEIDESGLAKVFRTWMTAIAKKTVKAGKGADEPAAPKAERKAKNGRAGALIRNMTRPKKGGALARRRAAKRRK